MSRGKYVHKCSNQTLSLTFSKINHFNRFSYPVVLKSWYQGCRQSTRLGILLQYDFAVYFACTYFRSEEWRAFASRQVNHRFRFRRSTHSLNSTLEDWQSLLDCMQKRTREPPLYLLIAKLVFNRKILFFKDSGWHWFFWVFYNRT